MAKVFKLAQILILAEISIFRALCFVRGEQGHLGPPGPSERLDVVHPWRGSESHLCRHAEGRPVVERIRLPSGKRTNSPLLKIAIEIIVSCPH